MDITEAIAWEDLAVMWLELEDPPETGNEDPAEECEDWPDDPFDYWPFDADR